MRPFGIKVTVAFFAFPWYELATAYRFAWPLFCALVAVVVFGGRPRAFGAAFLGGILFRLLLIVQKQLVVSSGSTTNFNTVALEHFADKTTPNTLELMHSHHSVGS